MTTTTATTSPAPVCTVRAPGEGPAFWVLTDCVTFPLTGAETGGAFAMADITVLPGGGPPPHVHAREDEIFYILDGTFALISDRRAFTARAGDCVFLPRGVTHTFKNVGASPGRFLTVATPAGWDAFVADAGYACADRTRPPEVTQTSFARLMAACQKHALEIRPEWSADQPMPPRAEDRAFWVAGHHVRFRLTSAETNGSFSVVEVSSPPGMFVPPHTHRVEDEVFFVLEGTYEFTLPTGPLIAPAGTLVYVPKGVLHGFRNAGDAPARLLDLHTPGGFEGFFEAAGTACTDASAGPPKEFDLPKFLATCARFGMDVPPPPSGT